MSDRSFISVVLAAFNAGTELKPSLVSILSQNDVEFELIIIDDGSTDETSNRLAEWAQKDKRIKVLRQENLGLTASLIRGCKEARGKYIARQDIGDLSLPGRLYRQMEILEKNPETVMVTCGYRFIGPKGEIMNENLPLHSADDWTTILRSGDDKQLYGPHHGSVMFRNAAYKAVGGYRPEFYFTQDLDLWTRLSAQGKLDYVPEILYQVGFGYDSISSRFHKQQQELRKFIAQATRRRNNGKTDDDLLQLAAAIRKTPNLNKTTSSHTAEADYFIGSCLAARRNPAARQYLKNVLRQYPFHGKAWAKLLWSYLGAEYHSS